MKMKIFYVIILLILIGACVPQEQIIYTPKTEYTSYFAKYYISLQKVERPEKATIRYGLMKIDTSQNKKFKQYFEDDMIKIFWMVTSRSIQFLVSNKTDYSIKIRWDEAVFIDENAMSHRVIHSGIKYNEKSNPQAPSVIARKAIIEDLIFPADYISWRDGGKYLTSEWYEKPFFEDFYFKGGIIVDKFSNYSMFDAYVKNNIGKTFQVVLPFQIENVVNDYIFTFVVENVICEKKEE